MSRMDDRPMDIVTTQPVQRHRVTYPRFLARALAAATDGKAKSAELIERYREEFASPYLSAGKGYISDVIEPSETRSTIALALRMSLNKRELRPAKKHGNIPL